MPELYQHLPLAEKNEKFADSISLLPERYPDWEITALFYSALHYVDAFLATQNVHPRTHDRRIESIRAFVESREDYRHLYQMSLNARYLMVSLTSEDAQEIRIGPFRRVKEEVLALLGNRPR